jgi:hypothetical protein
MRSLRYLNTILTVLAVLLAAQLWTTWTAPHLLASPSGDVADLATPAFAEARNAGSGGGIPDAGAQRKDMIDLLKKHAAQNDELLGLLRSGDVRVKLEQVPGDKK